MLDPSDTVMMSRMPCSSATTLTAFRSRLLLRENVSNWPVSFAPRSVARLTVAAMPRIRSSLLTRAINSELTMITFSKIVEIVCDAAGELTERFHFLRLHQHGLHLGALVNLHHQPVVGGREFLGAFGNAAFQRIVQLHQRLLRFDPLGEMAARFVLPRARPQRRRHRAPQRLRIQRTFEHDHVAELFEHFESASPSDARRATRRAG